MKKVYIVRGSEDGNLAVTSNIKAAYRIASEYIKQCDGDVNSYSQVCKGLNACGFAAVAVDSVHFGTAEIERHILESK